METVATWSWRTACVLGVPHFSFPALHLPCHLPVFHVLSAFVSTKLVLKYLFQVIEVLLSEERFSPCLYVYSKFTFFAAFHHGAHEQALHFSSMLYKMPTAYESFQWEWFLPVCIWEACISLSLTWTGSTTNGSNFLLWKEFAFDSFDRESKFLTRSWMRADRTTVIIMTLLMSH